MDYEWKDCFVLDTNILIYAMENFPKAWGSSLNYLREHHKDLLMPRGHMVPFGEKYKEEFRKLFMNRISMERKSKELLYYCITGKANCYISGYQLGTIEGKLGKSVRRYVDSLVDGGYLKIDNSFYSGIRNACLEKIKKDDDKEDCEVLARTNCSTLVTVDDDFLEICWELYRKGKARRCINLNTALRWLRRK